MELSTPSGSYLESESDRHELKRLLQTYETHFTVPALEHDESPFEMVTFFNLDEQVFLSDSTEDLEEI